MYVQIIQGRVGDASRFMKEAERWTIDLKPGATGFLGCTWGLADDGTGVVVARFDSEVSAKANSDRPAQGEWWAEMAPAFEDVAFVDCTEVDTMVGGGANEAGFVQLIQGRAKDKPSARAMMQQAEEQIAASRPDILGGLMAWHGDDGDFTQIVYFQTEEAARSAEGAALDSEIDSQYRDMMAIEPTFIDLTAPRFD